MQKPFNLIQPHLLIPELISWAFRVFFRVFVYVCILQHFLLFSSSNLESYISVFDRFWFDFCTAWQIWSVLSYLWIYSFPRTICLSFISLFFGPLFYPMDLQVCLAANSMLGLPWSSVACVEVRYSDARLLLLRIALVWGSLLCFCVNFNVIFSVSVKTVMGSLVQIMLTATYL